MQDILKQNPKLNLLLTYNNDKKLSKNIIISIHLSDFIDMIKNYNLRNTSKFLLGIVKIYSKKAKYILDDTNDLYSKFKPQKSHKKLLQPINKIEIDFSNVYVPEEDIYHSVIDSFVNNSEANILSDNMNFSISHAEVARCDGFKRRKIDDVIEIENKCLRIKFSKAKSDKDESIVNTLPEFVKALFRDYKQPVEIARAESMIGNFEPELSTFEMPNNMDSNSYCTSEVEMDIIDDEFCFNDYVIDKTRYEKAKMFLNILGMCTKDKMRCKQDESYGRIDCYMLNK